MTDGSEVLGGSTDAWQSLGGADRADDSAVAAQEAAAAGLREELGLIANAENLVVLVGLGASLGIKNAERPEQRAPRMSDLWSSSTTCLRSPLSRRP